MKIFFLNGLRKGEEFELSGDEVSIGRELNNDITVETEGVSRYHAKLFKQPDESWLLEDLDSLNGCKVNDKLIKGERPLKSGDIITLGDQTFRIDEDSKQPEAEPEPEPSGIPVIQPVKAGKTAVISPVIEPVSAKNSAPTVKKIVFQPMSKKASETDMKDSDPKPVISTVKPKAAVEKPKAVVDKTESEPTPEMTAKELSVSAANIFGDRGKSSKPEQKDSEPAARKHIFNAAFYLILLLGVVAFVFWFLNSNGEIKKPQEVAPAKDVKIPLVLHYVKTKITNDNIFRFSLLIENNDATFTIDDLKSDRHRKELIKDIKPEFIKAMKTAIEGTGYMDLQPVSKGSALNNLDEIREMTVALDNKINSITIQNNSAPRAFEDIETAIEEFADSYDLLTFAMSPKELMKRGEESFVKAEEYYANRNAKASNLLDAKRRYKITIDYLSQFTPKPKIWDIANKRYAEVESMRSKRYNELKYELERLERLSKIQEAIDVLNEMKELTPADSPFYKRINLRISILSQRLKARKR